MLFMLFLPAIARWSYRTDTNILQKYRRAYFVLTTIAFEASFGMILILGYVMFSQSVPSLLRHTLGLIFGSLIMVALCCMLPAVFIIVQTMRVRQHA